VLGVYVCGSGVLVVQALYFVMDVLWGTMESLMMRAKGMCVVFWVECGVLLCDGTHFVCD
jgi:hypothetical protein